MGKLCMTLPPFSPDYSGVCSALFPFETLTVIHDASGCTGNYTGYDEPRWFRSRSPIYCSGLREIDAILGDDEKLIQKVLYALEDIKPEMIALVGSPVPMVIGADMEGIAAEIESRTGIFSVGFPTTGIKYYPQGVELVYKKVLQRMLEEDDTEAVKEENSVNILGATPLDFGKSETIEELEAFLVENGYKINSSLWKNVSKEEILKLKNVACNIVVSNAGIAFADYLKKNYQIPYIIGLPYGEKNAESWLLKLKCCMDGAACGTEAIAGCESKADNEADVETASGKVKERQDGTKALRILIIGEQLQADSIRNALQAEHDVVCDVAGICGWNSRFAKENDTFLETEEEIERLLNDDAYDMIIGDPLYQEMLYEDKKFLAYSHYAVSSKLGNKESQSFIKKNIPIY